MEKALKIPDANVSYAITAEFSSETNRIHFYAFSVEAGHLLNFQLAVPAISNLENFAPVVLLIGPGLPMPDSFTTLLLNQFDVDLPSGSGATSYMYNGTDNEKEFEPFTQVNLLIRQEAEVTLPFQGVYYLAVAVPEGWTEDAASGFGKYVLAPGVLEEFSILDYMAIPLDWITWHSFWEDSVVLLLAPTFVVVTAGTFATWFHTEKRRADIFKGRPNRMKPVFYLGVVGATMMIGSAVNQLTLVFGYSISSFEPTSFIVVMLQSIGLFLGVLALRMMLGVTKLRSARSMMLAIASVTVVTFGALMVGAGWILGPMLFVFGYLAGLVLVYRLGQNGVASGT
jgi:hypothetical protein